MRARRPHVETGHGEQLRYDQRNRLINFAPTGQSTNHFSYDGLGNLIGRSTSAAGQQNQFYTHPDKPHAVHTVTGGGAFTYDPDGNALYRGSNGLFQTYDSENRLQCVGSSEGACNVASFAYDVDGQRILAVEGGTTRVSLDDLYEHEIAGQTQTGTDFVLAFGRRIVERRKPNPTLRLAQDLPWAMDFDLPPWSDDLLGAVSLATLLALAWRLGVFGAFRDRPLKTGIATTVALTLVPYPVSATNPNQPAITHRWFIQDHLGSAVLVISPTGTVVHRRVFEPFGQVFAETTPTEATRQLFTDQEYSPGTQLYDFDARWYDAGGGLFASVDPVLFAADPPSRNAYSYVRGNPMALTDPTGAYVAEFLGGLFLGGLDIGLTALDLQNIKDSRFEGRETWKDAGAPPSPGFEGEAGDAKGLKAAVQVSLQGGSQAGSEPSHGDVLLGLLLQAAAGGRATKADLLNGVRAGAR